MRNRDARLAGFLYLVSIAGGLFCLDYIPGRLFTPDPVATAHNILANEFLFRLAMVGDIALGAIWLFVVLALYRLLAEVDRTQAGLMLVLGAFMQVPLYFVNVVNYAGALTLVQNASFLSAFSEAQRDGMAMLFLRLHHYQLLASLLFAGLWLIPLGILVFKSGFLPRFFGAWLVVNGLAWLANPIVGFLTPQYADILDTITRPILFGEIAFMLWLLIAGARTIRLPA